MNRFWRNFLSIFVGLIFGYVGFLIVAIFWPLLFPAAIHGSSWGEEAVPIAILVFFTSFFVAGFLLCRKLTKRFFRDKDSTTVLFR